MAFHFLWKWHATTPSNVSLRRLGWRQMGHTKNSSQYLQSTKNITWPRWIYEAEMIIDLPCIHFYLLLFLRWNNMIMIWFIHIMQFGTRCLNIIFRNRSNKSNKQWEAMHYSDYSTITQSLMVYCINTHQQQLYTVI